MFSQAPLERILLNDIRKKTRKKSQPSNEDARSHEMDENLDVKVEETSASFHSTETVPTNGKSELKKQSQSRAAQPNKVNTKTKESLAKNNNTNTNNTNPLAFQPQLINDEDL